MFRSLFTKPHAIFVPTIIALCVTAVGRAQEASVGSPGENKLILAFRMQDWKTQHIHDAAAAKRQAETLRQLGCEVKSLQHDGHSDIQWRTVFWKSLALDTQEQLRQWQTWLNQAGFDTVHGRTPSTEKPAGKVGVQPEIVKYRLSDWRAQHIHQALEVGQMTTLYRALGCELEQLQHSGHTDLRIRCPEWLEIELPSHEAAHKWQEFLKNSGFETTHEH